MDSHVTDYLPHGICLAWEPWLIFFWVGSNALIVLSYFAIPFALLRVLQRRTDIRHRGLILLFASFILLCGITHAVSIVTLWVPMYQVDAALMLATGLVSAGTAVALFRLVPALVAIPSLASVQEANRKLGAEVAAHERTLADLRTARDDLERKVSERTSELRDLNQKLSVTAREAIHRSHNLIAVVMSIARQSARTQTTVPELLEVLNGRLSALADATGAIIRRHEQSSADLNEVVLTQLAPVLQTYPSKVHVDGPHLDIDVEAAQQISLAIHELATNAQKHGALVAADARVTVTYSVQRTAGESRLVLVWQESLSPTAPPVESSSEKKGFGTRLLMEIIPTMLHGTSSRLLSADHLTYTLDVPLAAILLDSARTGDEAFVTRILDENFGKA